MNKQDKINKAILECLISIVQQASVYNGRSIEHIQELHDLIKLKHIAVNEISPKPKNRLQKDYGRC